MTDIDAIRINFNPDQLFLLNICLAFLMFGVALNIKVDDFGRIFKKPKAPLVGLTSQLLLLPILTVALVYAFNPPTSIALGMLIVGVCPGGNVSNFMVHLSKGNTALSVLMTSIVTLGAVVITPFYFTFLTNFIPGTEAYVDLIYVEPGQMIQTIITLIIIPLVFGMFLNAKFPKFTLRIEKTVRILSIVIFGSFVVFAVIGNYENIVSHIGKVFSIVIVYNGLAYMMGFYFAKLNGLDFKECKAISIETGIQNSGLALILIFNFFDGLGGMAMIAAWWGIWHLLTGFALAMFWGNKKEPIQ